MKKMLTMSTHNNQVNKHHINLEQSLKVQKKLKDFKTL